jgi:hypothetical protein
MAEFCSKQDFAETKKGTFEQRRHAHYLAA